MSKRPRDEVTIESVAGEDLSILVDSATRCEITTDLVAPAQALFEMGDDASWLATYDALKTGARFQVRVNGLLRMTGRALTRSLPVSERQGSTIRLTIRTLLADAQYASASPSINVRRSTLRETVLAAYEPLGLTADDFIFDASVAVDLLTGKGGPSRVVDLAEIKEDAAKVHPPETIYAFVERHLNRFHLSHWDAPDGKIVVGAPDDEQEPIYKLQCYRGTAAVANNFLSAERVADFEQVPSILGVFGVGGGKAYAKAKVGASETVSELADTYRPTLLVDESIKTQAQAEAMARREMSMRRRRSDCWRFSVDGLSHWDGSTATPWAIDTVVDVDVVNADSTAIGPYLIHRVTMRGDPDDGFTTDIEAVAKGIWRL
jgi:prophage tail gpP-like protein